MYKNLSRGKEDELNQFFDNIDLFVNILENGNIFLKDDCFSNETTFICNRRNSNLTGHLSSGGFTVKKGPQVSNDVTEALETDSRYKLRKSLEKNGIILNKTFNIDYEFT